MSDEYRKTKAGIAICPFFGWTSENIENLGPTEYDVNLIHCSHEENKITSEGNCQRELCPLVHDM